MRAAAGSVYNSKVITSLFVSVNSVSTHDSETANMTNSEPEMELSSAQPHPFNGQVEELQRLILASGPEQGDYDNVCQRAAGELDKIASKLRDCKLASYLPQLTPASQRTPFAQTDLPMILCKIVEAKPVGTAQQQKLWQQAGRVAANLSADCDLARERLSKYGYAPAVLKLLSTDLPHDVSVPLTASLLNLTNDKLRKLSLPPFQLTYSGGN